MPLMYSTLTGIRSRSSIKANDGTGGWPRSKPSSIWVPIFGALLRLRWAFALARTVFAKLTSCLWAYFVTTSLAGKTL
jgi:hypothetical protein